MEENMKVQVPSDAYIAGLGASQKTDNVLSFRYGFLAAIAYANEQLASKSPFLNDLEVHELGKELRGGVALITKRPFLSDSEIEDEVKDFDYAEDRELYRTAARWARDKYEAALGGGVPGVEPKWQPVVGQKCAFWSDGDTSTIAGGFQFSGLHNDGSMLYSTADRALQYCAALDSYDEIGKPPSYFQERGRSTV
jgi:hypothetical protein